MGKCLLMTLVAMIFVFALVLSGCTAQTSAHVTSIAKTGSNGAEDIYTITYSDGTTDTFTVTNGTDGTDGKDADISDIYEAYKEQTGNSDLSFKDFLTQYLTLNTDMSSAINSSLRSVAKIYAEFVETETVITGGSMLRPEYGTRSGISVSTGAAVIYSMDTSEDGYTYFVTDYHVIYNNDADASLITKTEPRSPVISMHIYTGARAPLPQSTKTATGMRTRTTMAIRFTTTATMPLIWNMWAARSPMTLPFCAPKHQMYWHAMKMRSR